MTGRTPHYLAIAITDADSAQGDLHRSRATWLPSGSPAYGIVSRSSRRVTPRFGLEPLWFQIEKSYGWKKSWPR